MQVVYFAFLPFLILSLTIDSPSCVPKERDCSFYSNCMESKIPCGPKGYSLGYGGKYCEKFKENHSSFSAAGQEWIWDVMSCLQNRLVPVLNEQPLLTCANLKTFAFESHASCYTAKGNSVCSLPPSDWSRLLWIIRRELFDAETYKTAIMVLSKCGEDFDFLSENHLE